MQHRIISSNSSTGQIEVEYSHDGVVVGVYAVDVPIVNGSYLSGAALDTELSARSPTWVVDRRTQVQSATGFDAIEVAANAGSPAQVSLETIKELRMEDVNRHREKLMKAGVVFAGYQFDSDDLSVTRLTAVVAAVSAGVPLPGDFVWRSSANIDVPLQASGLVGLLATMIMRANEIYGASWAVKQLISAATTAVQVAAVTWDDPLGGAMD